MLTTLAIDDITCDALSKDLKLFRQVLPTLRTFFREDLKKLEIADTDDTALLRLSKARYENRDFNEEALKDHAAEEYRLFVYQYRIPVHVCSWIRKQVLAEQKDCAA